MSSAFGITQQLAASGNIIENYSDKLVVLLTEQINAVPSAQLSNAQKIAAIQKITDEPPKTKDQLREMMGEIVKQIYVDVQTQIWDKCFFIIPKSLGVINPNAIVTGISDGSPYAQITSDNHYASGVISGRIYFHL